MKVLLGYIGDHLPKDSVSKIINILALPFMIEEA